MAVAVCLFYSFMAESMWTPADLTHIQSFHRARTVVLGAFMHYNFPLDSQTLTMLDAQHKLHDDIVS